MHIEARQPNIPNSISRANSTLAGKKVEACTGHKPKDKNISQAIPGGITLEDIPGDQFTRKTLTLPRGEKRILTYTQAQAKFEIYSAWASGSKNTLLVIPPSQPPA